MKRVCDKNVAYLQLDVDGWINTKRSSAFDTHKVSLQGPLNIIDETVTGEFE